MLEINIYPKKKLSPNDVTRIKASLPTMPFFKQYKDFEFNHIIDPVNYEQLKFYSELPFHSHDLRAINELFEVDFFTIYTV